MNAVRGRHALTNEPIEVCFGKRIHSIELQFSQDFRAHDVFLAPGLVDLQINGFAGVDYCSPETAPEQIVRSMQSVHATGVTQMLPTVITNAPSSMIAAARNIAAAMPHSNGAIVGIHMEGPYISPKDGPRGAHPTEHVRQPSWDEFERWQEASGGAVRMVTLAPEWPGAHAFIERLVDGGMVVAIGHTAATADEIRDAVAAGASMVTHIGNAMPGGAIKTHPIWQMLSDERLNASVIADAFHLPEAFLQTVWRMKGREGLVLITDAVAPAGCAPGRYSLGSVDVELHAGGRVTIAQEDRLAGSSLQMHQAISNMMSTCGVPLAGAITMAAQNPRRLLKLEEGLAEGSPANFVRFRIEEGLVEVQQTWLDGTLVYERPA
jgi:N-acetylglucosamine-6-phosphate deacetylase